MTEMTAKEQFRVGFLMRCAEEGCTVDDIRQRVKYAATLAPAAGGFLTGGGLAAGLGTGEAAKQLPSLVGDYFKSPIATAAAMIAAGAGAGGLAGAGLGAMTSSDVNPEELKQKELLQAYKAQADRLRQLAATQKQQPAVRSPRLLR